MHDFSGPLRLILENGGPMGVIGSLAILLLSGFLMTRLTQKLRLPHVTGYIFAGIIIGPYFLDLIPRSIISGMDFVSDIVLALIAFGLKVFKTQCIKQSGISVIIITLFEALAAVVVTLSMIFIFDLPVSFSLILGDRKCNSTCFNIMTIRQYKAKSHFVNILLQLSHLMTLLLIAFVFLQQLQRRFAGSQVVPALISFRWV